MGVRTLAFGLNEAIPETATTAWGARWIFPNDQLWDRQDFAEPKTPDGERLMAWLNGGAIRKAMDNVAGHALRKNEMRTVTLYEDETGVIKGDPRGSHGYLYVCAYLKP